MGWIVGVFVCAAIVALLIFAVHAREKPAPLDHETEEKIRAGIKRAGLNSKTVWGK